MKLFLFSFLRSQSTNFFILLLYNHNIIIKLSWSFSSAICGDLCNLILNTWYNFTVLLYGWKIPGQPLCLKTKTTISSQNTLIYFLLIINCYLCLVDVGQPKEISECLLNMCGFYSWAYWFIRVCNIIIPCSYFMGQTTPYSGAITFVDLQRVFLLEVERGSHKMQFKIKHWAYSEFCCLEHIFIL